MLGQKSFNEQKNEIELEIFVDEAKEVKYKNEKITYIMLMAIPTNKKEKLYNKLNNSRCLYLERDFNICTEKCKYHECNNVEIHYSEINQGNSTIKKKIAEKWINILLDNNFKNENAIYFNVLGIIESNLDLRLFGKSEHANIYSRFFRTNLLRLLRMYDEYDKIIIKHIYHDSTTEMEQHRYFKTNAIRKLKSDSIKREKIVFETNEIEFIDSKHYKGNNPIESQFIQFVDLILGLTVNVIHGNATNRIKKDLSQKLQPLIFRILDKESCKRKSKYNYFNKQAISFFPKYSKDELSEKLKKDTIEESDIELLLKAFDNFDNNKKILSIEEEGEQMSLF